MIVTHDNIAVVDLTKEIELYTWIHDMYIISMRVDVGMAMIGRSKRFETEHTTATVRTLTEEDCEYVNKQVGTDLVPQFPVVFKQAV